MGETTPDTDELTIDQLNDEPSVNVEHTGGKKTIIYARISTDQQDLEHQKENLWRYATQQLNLPPDSIEVYADTKSGRNAKRDGFIAMRDDIDDGVVERIIAREVSRLGRDMTTIHNFVSEAVEERGIGLHITDDNITIEPGEGLSMMDKMLLTVLGWAAELEAEKMLENQRSMLEAAREAGKWPSRPPYGFTTNDDGYLTPTDEYHNAIAAIFAVETMGWSKRRAARYSGVPRSTLNSMLTRTELYLPDVEWAYKGHEVTVANPDSPFVPDTLSPVHEAVLTALESGPMPSQTLINQTQQHAEDATETDATLAVVQLIMGGYVGGVDDHDDLWHVENPPEMEA